MVMAVTASEHGGAGGLVGSSGSRISATISLGPVAARSPGPMLRRTSAGARRANQDYFSHLHARRITAATGTGVPDRPHATGNGQDPVAPGCVRHGGTGSSGGAWSGLGLHAAAGRVALLPGLRVLLALLGSDAGLDLVAEVLVDVAPVLERAGQDRL